MNKLIPLYISLKKYVLIGLFILFYHTSTFAMPASGNGCDVPFSPCWCLTHPNESPCQNAGIPINNELWVLMAAGLVFGVFYFKKSKSPTS